MHTLVPVVRLYEFVEGHLNLLINSYFSRSGSNAGFEDFFKFFLKFSKCVLCLGLATNGTRLWHKDFDQKQKSMFRVIIFINNIFVFDVIKN